MCLLDCGNQALLFSSRDVSGLACRARRYADGILNLQSQFFDNENTVNWPTDGGILVQPSLAADTTQPIRGRGQAGSQAYTGRPTPERRHAG